MGVIDWLLGRAPRERVLLALLGALILPAAVAFAWLEPLAARRQAAEAALGEAQALNAWVRDRQGEMAGLVQAAPGGSGDAAGSGGPVGASALEQSLVAARLRDQLTALETGGDGGVVLRFETVEFARLMGWIDDEAAGWGYDIATLRLEQSPRAGLVTARLVLVPAE